MVKEGQEDHLAVGYSHVDEDEDEDGGRDVGKKLLILHRVGY